VSYRFGPDHIAVYLAEVSLTRTPPCTVMELDGFLFLSRVDNAFFEIRHCPPPLFSSCVPVDHQPPAASAAMFRKSSDRYAL